MLVSKQTWREVIFAMLGQDFKISPVRLVRDHVPALARRDGAGLVFDLAPEQQLDALMADKVVEEVGEFASASTPEEELDRLASMYELLDRLARRRARTMDDLAERARQIRADKGGFTLGFILIPRTLRKMRPS